jgi:Baseplate J-like protein
MAQQRILYTVRDFQQIRTELINYTKLYYPDLVDNFNDASIYSALMDLNAAVADNLHFHIDRSIQETVLQYAQQKSSIFNIARTYGLKLPGQRPSLALVDFSITVPAFGDKDDERYEGVLRMGSQFAGAGQTFENIYDIDFKSPFDAQGYPNKLKIPNFDSNNNLINYTIVKRELVVNGVTKVYKQVINATDVRPFFEIFLPDTNVVGVTSIIQKDGTSYSNIPTVSDFLSPVGKWYEVNALAEDRVFIEDPTKPSDVAGLKVGSYIVTNNRYITEYTPQGYLKITFGGGNTSADDQLRSFARSGINVQSMQTYLNNFSLGSTVQPNTTIFVQYRVGGGLNSNVGVNVINQVGSIQFAVNGPSDTTNTSVIGSLKCTNVTAAIGGAGLPTIEEVRNFVAFNFSAQERAVTIQDYEALIRKMPGQFGAPAKVAILEQDNKIKVKILSYDSNGALTSIVSNTLLKNIAEYLSNYRMINDYISVETAEVLDLAVEASLVLDASQNQGTVIGTVINLIADYFNPSIRQLGQNVNIPELTAQIQNQNGVISITDLKFYNRVGGDYSSSVTSMVFVDPSTREILPTDSTIFALPNQVYQIRYPNKDITVRVKNFQTVTLS